MSLVMKLQVQESLPLQYDTASMCERFAEFLDNRKELFGFQKGRKIAGTAEVQSAFREAF